MAASSRSRASINPDLSQEIIVEILIRVPPKSLLKCKCVSKSWLQLISSPHFVKTHLKLAANDKELRLHRVLFRVNESKCEVRCLSSLFCKEPNNTELFNLEVPPILCGLCLDSSNGLICLFERMKLQEGFIWNPAIKKVKKLPRLEKKTLLDPGCDYFCIFGFGYDKLHDDYKLVVVQCIGDDDGLHDTVLYIYSLRTDSWRTVHEFQGYLLNDDYDIGKCVNGKLYWASPYASEFIDECNAYIVSLDLEDETWGKLELPNYGEDKRHSVLGAVGSDLSMLCSCCQGTTCDVWIMKDSGVDISWTKMFTVEYTQDIVKKREDTLTSSFWPFSRYVCQSNTGEVLLLLPPIVIIYNPKDGSTRQSDISEVNGYDYESEAAEIYVESLVDPLSIAD